MTDNLDKIRGSVLDRMERSNRLMKYAIIGAALAEAMLIGEGLFLIDFTIRFEKVVYLLFLATYMILALGMVALGAHVSRTADRVLAVLDKQ